jgi:hypothetical protein
MYSEMEAYQEKLKKMEADRQALIAAEEEALRKAEEEAENAEESDDKEEDAPSPDPETKEEDKKEEAKEESSEEKQEESPEEDDEDDSSTAKRLRKLYAEAREARRIAAEQQKELEILRKQREPTQDESLRLEAARIAQEETFKNEFNAKCDKVAEAGKAAYKDFNETLRALWDTVGPIQQNVPFVEAVIAAGEDNSHKLFRWLGKNPDEAERISRLSPVQAGVALAKQAAKLSAPPAPKPVSKMPAPITPIQSPGTGASSSKSKDPSKMNAAEMRDWMNEQAYQKRMARHQ